MSGVTELTPKLLLESLHLRASQAYIDRREEEEPPNAHDAEIQGHPHIAAELTDHSLLQGTPQIGNDLIQNLIREKERAGRKETKSKKQTRNKSKQEQATPKSKSDKKTTRRPAQQNKRSPRKNRTRTATAAATGTPPPAMARKSRKGKRL